MVALVIYNTSEATCDCKCEITEKKRWIYILRDESEI